MAAAKSDTELLTEHFGYPPVSLIDDIINSVNILAERALNSVEQGLLNAPPATLGFKTNPPPKQKKDSWNPAEAAKTEIEAGTHQLETLLCASIDRNFDKFELYVLRNILCVRPPDLRDWIRLSHYDGLDFSDVATTGAAGGSDIPSLESINDLRRKLRESMRLNALLTAERERNARTLRQLQHLVVGGTKIKRECEESSTSGADGAATAAGKGPSPFAFLQQKGTLTEAGGSTPLSTTTAFTMSQLQALRDLSTSLRNVTPELTPPPPGDRDKESDDDEDGDESKASGSKKKKKTKKTWRQERTEYVEHATRRHLETVHGLELGKDGEVRDGEWQGEGRKLGPGEVEGLERVVAILGNEDSSSTPTQTPDDAIAPPSRSAKDQGSARKRTPKRTPRTPKAATNAAEGDLLNLDDL